jgi:hypothetical protein
LSLPEGLFGLIVIGEVCSVRGETAVIARPRVVEGKPSTAVVNGDLTLWAVRDCP